jgi:hypothetical protein
MCTLARTLSSSRRLADAEHEEHENMLQWRGPFDPETFSPAQVSQGLQKKFRSRKLAKAANPV